MKLNTIKRSVLATKEANQHAVQFKLWKHITIDFGAAINLMPQRLARQNIMHGRIATILKSSKRIFNKMLKNNKYYRIFYLSSKD